MSGRMLVLVAAVLLSEPGVGVYGEEGCPESSAISEVYSHSETIEAAGPFDWSVIRSEGARLKRNGTGLGVYLSNGDFTVPQMASDYVVPIKETGVFIIAINFSHGKDQIEAGTYSAESGFGKPFWATAEIKVAKEEKGAIVSLGVREGTATITDLGGGRVCGTFDLQLRQKDGTLLSSISGEFNVPLE